MLIQCPGCNEITQVDDAHPVCPGEVEWECPSCLMFWRIETHFDLDDDAH
ncbi:hypothetical protein LCGC14_1857260 [marine sediment metagenome]|uniref:CPXCG motif-containing cysteine-rich protein n=1 Tax=marine sediment metagenome TaxID=412755 RepID=A0A0F9IN05_9ZZZZ